jgi:peptide-methionine (S)-S-oxide reductase
MEHVWLGCGCFWSAEEAYREHRGVAETEVGFLTVEGERVEVVRIAWDPVEIDLSDLLDVFFRIHDPTADLSLDEEGARSVIGLTDPVQEPAARAALEHAMASGRFVGQARTLLVVGAAYERAADEHQGYLARQSD